MTKYVLFSIVIAAACGGSKHEAAGPTGGGSAEPAMGSAAGSATDMGSAAGSATDMGSATGSAAGSAEGSAAMAGSAAAPTATGEKAYKDMDKKERAAFMKRVVLPKAKELFASFDPKFGEVTCRTCHGDGVDNHTFKMPNPKIKPLPATEEGFMAWIKKNPEEGKWAKFMSEQLEPAMGQMLGMAVFDPKTKTGELSCNTCHTLQK